MSTVTEETVVSANRSGPPGCGNGGWVAGLVAERLDDLTAGEGGGPATHIRLTAPTPLERPLRWEVAGTVGEPEDLAVHLLDGDTLLATATHVPAPDLEVPAPVTPEQAAAAVESFDPSGNPFPTCYGCGHEASDGLHVYAAPVPGREEVNAAPVVLDEEGLAPVFTALDCPGAFALGFEESILTGSFTITVHEEVPRGRELVVMSWVVGREGRKRHTGTALLDGDTVLATAATTWIALRPESTGGTP
ncbi:hypothetical protein [Janibacter corallicola]|uniref:hypothetical protein n=1 Tax=Janibacter corallicola TaxID=415212 RepID=UPI000832E9A7|nr:hypothetical protein [Janibacter corallicola]